MKKTPRKTNKTNSKINSASKGVKKSSPKVAEDNTVATVETKNVAPSDRKSKGPKTKKNTSKVSKNSKRKAGSKKKPKPGSTASEAEVHKETEKAPREKFQDKPESKEVSKRRSGSQKRRTSAQIQGKKQLLMPNSSSITEAAQSIDHDFDNFFVETSCYIDKAQIFEKDVWEKIKISIDKSQLIIEKIVAKCVDDRIPKRYGMSQGEFFWGVWGLKPYEVSKMLSRNKVREKFAQTTINSDYIKNTLVDRIATFINQEVSIDLLTQELESLYESASLNLPTVAVYESRIKSKLLEQSNLAKLQAQQDNYVDDYDINSSDNEQNADRCQPNSSGSNNSFNERMLQTITTQLNLVQQTLEAMNNSDVDR